MKFQSIRKRLNRISSRQITVIMCLISFLIMFIWNLLTPLYDDDIFFTNLGFKQVISGGIHDYLYWNNRFFGQSFVRLLCSNNQVIVSFLNALMFVLMSFLIMSLARKGKKWSNFIYLFVISSMIIFIPAFGQTFLWRAGAGNYLYPMDIMLLFMYIYLNTSLFDVKLSHRHLLLVIIFLIFAFIAGWQNENTSGGVLLILLLNSIFDSYHKRKHNIIYYLGLLFFTVGYAFLIFGPGSYARASQDPTAQQSLPYRLMTGSATVTQAFLQQAGVLLLLIVVLFLLKLNFDYQLEKIFKPLFWLIGGLATIYVLIFSTEGQGGGRTFFGGVIFLIICMVNLLPEKIKIGRRFDFFILQLILISTLIYAGMSFIIGFVDSYNSDKAIKERYSFIEKKLTERRTGDTMTIHVEKLGYTPQTKYSLNYGLTDIGKNANVFPNTSYTAYYGNYVKIVLK